MHEFKKVGIWSFTKFSAVTGLIIGLLFGLLLLILSLILGASSNSSALLGSIGGIGSLISNPWLLVIILPLVYGLFGLVGGAISGLLYNLVAKMVGGIRLEIIEVETASQ